MTQKSFVISHLRANKEITRNECLQNRLTRLSAIIFDLGKEGWIIKGDWRKTAYGKDYIYFLISEPKLKPYQLLKKRFEETGQLSFN